MAKFIRIIAILSGIPGMFFFYYILMSAGEWGLSSVGTMLVYLLAIGCLCVPLAFYYISKIFSKGEMIYGDTPKK